MTAALLALLLSHAPADLKFMAGSWRAVDPDPRHRTSSEEVWVVGEGGLTGLYRENQDGKPGFYELSTIVPEGEALVLSMRMFDRGLKDAKKTSAGPLRFVASAVGFHKVTFTGEGANKATLTYELLNPHTLQVTLDRADGAPVERFSFNRFFL